MELNNIKYKTGLKVVFKDDVYEIHKVLCIAEKYFFWCIQMEMISFDSYSNCLKIRHTNSPKVQRLIGLDDLIHKNTYECMCINDEMYLQRIYFSEIFSNRIY